MSNREETLAKNILIFAIGNIGSKLVQVILVPFYARILTTPEYGTVDILQSVVALLLPICALSIFESVFRYAMDAEYNKLSILNVGLTVSAVGVAAMCLLGGIASAFLPQQYTLYMWLVIANTAANAFWTVLSQYTKAIGHSKLFAFNNILLTIVVLLLNVLFLAVLRWGITGYMLGYTLANLIAAVFLMVCLKDSFRIDVRQINRQMVRQMLRFSLPLVLNGICWWLSSFTDRIMITGYLGVTANSQYAAASKLPHLLSIMIIIFYQAWQISANKEFHSTDASQFYAKAYELNSACTFIGGSALILICRPLNRIFMGSNYADAWRLIPPLVLMTVFFSFCQFLISIYSANKKTDMALYTNLSCVLSNILLNWLFIPRWGMMGAALATAISYFLLWIVRIITTRRVVPIRYNRVHIIVSTAIMIVQSILLNLNLNVLLTYILSAVGFLVILLLHRDTVLAMIHLLIKMVKKKGKDGQHEI